MNGRLERELKENKKMKARLETLPPIFTEFYFYLEGEGKSYTTLTNYVNHNVDFMNFITVEHRDDEYYTQVKPMDINRYMASIRHKEVDGNIIRVGDDIRAARWTSLKTFFEFLKNNEYIVESPMDKTKRPKIKTEHKVTYLTKEEISKVLNTVRLSATDRSRSRDLCIISLALSTGLRVSAITQINLEDIDLDNNTITVIEKGNKTRSIKFGNNLGVLLWKYIADRNKYYPDVETSALFLSRCKRRMTTQAVRDLVAKYTQDIKGKHITPHKLRASAATNLAAAGVSMQAIAEVLGHNNIQTTRRYVKVLDEEAQEAVDTLDNLI